MRLSIRRLGSFMFGTSDTIGTSAGAADVGKVAHLDATGKFDDTMLPNALGALSTVTVSAGAGDVGKAPVLDAAGLLDVSVIPTAGATSDGAGDAGKAPVLDGGGLLDKSFLPFNLANANADFMVYFTAGAPVDYTDGSPPATGEGVAGIGSIAINVTAGKLYINGGTKAQPIWKIVTSAA